MHSRTKGSTKRSGSAHQGPSDSSTIPSDDDPEEYEPYDQTLPKHHPREPPPIRYPPGTSPQPHSIDNARSLHGSSRHGPPEIWVPPSSADNNDSIRSTQNPIAAHARRPPPEKRPTAPAPAVPINSTHSYPTSSRHGPLEQRQMLPYPPNSFTASASIYANVPPPQSIQTSDSGNYTTKTAKDSHNSNKVSLDQSSSLHSESNMNVYIQNLQINPKPDMDGPFSPSVHPPYVQSSQPPYSTHHSVAPIRSAPSGSPYKGDNTEYKDHRSSRGTKESSRRYPDESEAPYRYDQEGEEPSHQAHRGGDERLSSTRSNKEPRPPYSVRDDFSQTPMQRPIPGDLRSFSLPLPDSSRSFGQNESENTQPSRKRPTLDEKRAISDPAPLLSERYPTRKERPGEDQGRGPQQPVYQQWHSEPTTSEQSYIPGEEEPPLGVAVPYRQKSHQPKETMQPSEGRGEQIWTEPPYKNPSFPYWDNRQKQTSSTDSVQTVRAGQAENVRPVDKGKRPEVYRNPEPENSHPGGTPQTTDRRYAGSESTGPYSKSSNELGYQPKEHSFPSGDYSVSLSGPRFPPNTSTSPRNLSLPSSSVGYPSSQKDASNEQWPKSRAPHTSQDRNAYREANNEQGGRRMREDGMEPRPSMSKTGPQTQIQQEATHEDEVWHGSRSRDRSVSQQSPSAEYGHDNRQFNHQPYQHPTYPDPRSIPPPAAFSNGPTFTPSVQLPPTQPNAYGTFPSYVDKSASRYLSGQPPERLDMNRLSLQHAIPSGSPYGQLPTISETAYSLHPPHDPRKSSPSETTLPDTISCIGLPYLVSITQKKNNELSYVKSWVKRNLSATVERHIPWYMASPIIGQDSIPLWYPAPRPLGQSRALRAIEVGDIGYLDDCGEFHTISNIFNSFLTPTGCRLPGIRIGSDTSNMVRHVELQKHHLYTSKNIVRDERNRHFRFSISRKAGRSGAIIVLPHGGESSSLRPAFYQRPEVKEYFRQNAPLWYQHAGQPNTSNGSLLFIQGTYKARTWGIAAFNSSTEVREPQHISFSPTENNGYEYQWDRYDHVDRWKTRVGPASRELAQSGGTPRLDQCIGIIASAVYLDDETWNTYFARNSISPSSKKSRSSFRPLSHVLSRFPSMSSIKGRSESFGRRPNSESFRSYQGPQYAGDYELIRMP